MDKSVYLDLYTLHPATVTNEGLWGVPTKSVILLVVASVLGGGQIHCMLFWFVWQNMLVMIQNMLIIFIPPTWAISIAAGFCVWTLRTCARFFDTKIFQTDRPFQVAWASLCHSVVDGCESRCIWWRVFGWTWPLCQELGLSHYWQQEFEPRQLEGPTCCRCVFVDREGSTSPYV